jgi:hypothetical protein
MECLLQALAEPEQAPREREEADRQAEIEHVAHQIYPPLLPLLSRERAW